MLRKLIATLILGLCSLFFVYALTASQTITTASAITTEKDSKKSISEGRKLFMQYCATCHGATAKGDGPSGRALKKAPSDLTKIQKENGKFPSLRIQRVISGEDSTESHGTRDMPIWGSVLRQRGGHGFAQLEIYNLTNYIESIQQ